MRKKAKNGGFSVVFAMIENAYFACFDRCFEEFKTLDFFIYYMVIYTRESSVSVQVNLRIEYLMALQNFL